MGEGVLGSRSGVSGEGFLREEFRLRLLSTSVVKIPLKLRIINEAMRLPRVPLVLQKGQWADRWVDAR